MHNLKVLMTGDYWHADFQSLIGAASFPITLQPLQSISDGEDDERSFDLVVIAQSRRGQYDVRVIENLMARFVNVPVVALCGSWCEGETRSGSPVAGLIRVYWHQWQGQLDDFLTQIREQQIAAWQLPKIAATPDRVMHQISNLSPNFGRTISVGVSTLTYETYLMLQDAAEASNFDTEWIEGIDINDNNRAHFSVLCVEGNSLNADCQQRIRQLQDQFPHTPIVLVLNFPRLREFQLAGKMGVTEVVSKPFQLCDLRFAVERLLRNGAA